MNKTAIKNFAIWARNKLIADISYKAGLMGIAEDGVKSALPQSTKDVEFYNIGTKEPYSITGKAIAQRRKLTELIGQKAKASDYQTAYRGVIEEVAYTWFNRLIAIRFMEVNDYLPSRIRVLSSESGTKLEPDLVTTPFDAELGLSDYEQSEVLRLKNENKVDELFQMLFIRQCNELNQILPKLFETTADYTELLLNVSVTDQDGVVYRLVHEIPEDDFNISKIGEDGEPTGQVEIIGWLYQYYNTEQNELVYDGTLSREKISKELVPAATTIYTPDWAVRYMVENSLGRLWIEGHPNTDLKTGWKYYLDEAQQEADVQAQLDKLREEYMSIRPEDIKVIDPCMGSGHILVYAFDILMQIYESAGYAQRDAAKSILEHNLYGLDISDRAFQLAYFAVMMKARQYNRRILNGETDCHVYTIIESGWIGGAYQYEMGNFLLSKEHQETLNYLLEAFKDAKEYGSILRLEDRDYAGLMKAWKYTASQTTENMNLTLWYDAVAKAIPPLIEQAIVLSQKYDVVVTNPPYLGSSRFSPNLDQYVKKNYADEKSDLSMVMLKKAMTGFSHKNGFISFITTSSWMFLSSFEKLRSFMLSNLCIDSLVDFGTELFEGKVGHNPIVSWVNRNSRLNYKMTGIRLVDYCYSRRDEKEPEFFNKENLYESAQNNFSKIPGSPIAYWVSEYFIKAYSSGETIGSFSSVSEGIKTGNNELYLRLWFEIPAYRFSFGKERDGFKWYPHHKGGDYRKWYGNFDWVINWENNGYAIKNSKNSGLQGANMYFNEFAGWSKISSKGNPLRYFKRNTLFDSGAPAMSNDSIKLCLALFNGKVGQYYLAVLSPTLNLQVGDVKRIPLLSKNNNAIEMLVNVCIDQSKADWDSFETSWDFTRHPLVGGGSVAEAYALWEQECTDRFNTLKANEEELNRIFIDIYGLQDELTPEEDDKDVTVRKADLQRDIKSLISYAVGCMFGRYSLNVDGLAYAGGDWDDSKYSTFIPDKDNILPITDEEYFEDDIVGLFCAWLKKVYGADTLEENLDFIAKALGSKGNTSREVIRNYFLNDFFKDHCKIYQKRPIYWLFDSGNQNGFKALIYMHRYDKNTIGDLRIDYLHRMERVYDSEIARMQDVIDNSTAAREVTAATKRKEKLQKQVKECKDYDEKIAHLALARIKIDLDDGVKVNYEKVQTVDGKKYPVLAKI